MRLCASVCVCSCLCVCVRLCLCVCRSTKLVIIERLLLLAERYVLTIEVGLVVFTFNLFQCVSNTSCTAVHLFIYLLINLINRTLQ